MKNGRQRAFWLLAVVVAGGLVAPVVHRVHHAEVWRELHAARHAAHGHDHSGVALCNALDTLPVDLQDSACALCHGMCTWAVPDQEQLIPIRLVLTVLREPDAGAALLDPSSFVIRGPPGSA